MNVVRSSASRLVPALALALALVATTRSAAAEPRRNRLHVGIGSALLVDVDQASDLGAGVGLGGGLTHQFGGGPIDAARAVQPGGVVVAVDVVGGGPGPFAGGAATVTVGPRTYVGVPGRAYRVQLDGGLGVGVAHDRRAGAADAWLPGVAVGGAFRFPLPAAPDGLAVDLRLATVHSPSTPLDLLLFFGDRKFVSATLGVDAAW